MLLVFCKQSAYQYSMCMHHTRYNTLTYYSLLCVRCLHASTRKERCDTYAIQYTCNVYTSTYLPMRFVINMMVVGVLTHVVRCVLLYIGVLFVVFIVLR